MKDKIIMFLAYTVLIGACLVPSYICNCPLNNEPGPDEKPYEESNVDADLSR